MRNDETEGITFWSEKPRIDGEQGMLFGSAVSSSEILAARTLGLIDGT
jgi:hypothetical protein